MLTTNTQTLAD